MPAGQDLAAPWISTPAFLADRAKRIHTALHALNDVISQLQVSGRLSTDNLKYRQWKGLLANWGAWYGQTSGTSWLWSGTDATLETYERAIKDWERWVLQTFPDTAPSLPIPPPTYGPGGEERRGVPLWVWGVGAALGTYGLAKLFGKL